MQKRLSEFTNPIPYMCAQIAECHSSVLNIKTHYWRNMFEYIVNRYGLDASELMSKREINKMLYQPLKFRVGRNK